MIKVEGFMAFRGVMLIVPKTREPFLVDGDWLYKPTTECWYCKGRSYPKEICKVQKDLT